MAEFALDPEVKVGEDEFTSTVRKMAEALRKVPGRVSEQGIRQLAGNNRFEVFEDSIENGTRISLGGTIVLIDIDFGKDEVVQDVKVSLASTVSASNEATSWLSKSLPSTADATLLRLLNLPLLDKFASVLSVLARADRLSTPNSPDCFVAIDEVATALFRIKGETNSKESPVSPYGVPVLNSGDNLGLSIWYWMSRLSGKERKNLVHWRVREAREAPTKDEPAEVVEPHRSIRYSTGWISNVTATGDGEATVSWNEPEPLKDSRAEFVLELDPPVLLPESVASSLDATVSSTVIPDSVRRYKAAAYSAADEQVTIDFMYSSLLPGSIVEVTEIPIGHPKELVRVLGTLRRYSMLFELWQSVSSQDRLVSDEFSAEDHQEMVSFSDAIAMDVPELGKSSLTTVTLQQDSAGEAAIELTVPGAGVVGIGADFDGSIHIISQGSENQEVAHLEKVLTATRDISLLVTAMR